MLDRFVTRITLPRAIGGIFLVAAAFTLAAAVLMRIIEPHTFDDFGSACWWAVQTVSTVGYGDRVPTTFGGQLLASAVMLFGIALVPAITSLVVTVLLRQRTGAR